MNCPACQHPYSHGDRFCGNCGHSLGDYGQAPRELPVAPQTAPVLSPEASDAVAGGQPNNTDMDCNAPLTDARIFQPPVLEWQAAPTEPEVVEDEIALQDDNAFQPPGLEQQSSPEQQQAVESEADIAPPIGDLQPLDLDKPMREDSAGAANRPQVESDMEQTRLPVDSDISQPRVLEHIPRDGDSVADMSVQIFGGPCIRCGKSAEPGQAYCVECTAERSLKRMRIFVVAFSLVLVCVVAGTAFFLWQSGMIGEAPPVEGPRNTMTEVSETEQREDSGHEAAPVEQAEEAPEEEEPEAPREEELEAPQEDVRLDPAYEGVMDSLRDVLFLYSYYVNDDGTEDYDWEKFVKWKLEDYTREIEAGNDLMYYHRSTKYFLDEEPASALIDIHRAIELYPEKAHYYAQRAFVYAKMGNQRRALDDALKAIELDPQDPAYHAQAGAIYADLGRYDEAAARYTESINTPLGDEWEDAYSGRAYVYLKQGEPEKALADLDHMFERPESIYNHKPFYLLRALTYCMLERYDEAMIDLDALMLLDDDCEPAIELREIAESKHG